MSFVPKYQKVANTFAASHYMQVFASFPLPSCNVFPVSSQSSLPLVEPLHNLTQDLGGRMRRVEEEKDKHAFMSPLTAFEAYSLTPLLPQMEGWASS